MAEDNGQEMIRSTHVAKYEDSHPVVHPAREKIEHAPVSHRVDHPVRQLASDELEHLDGAEMPVLVGHHFAVEQHDHVRQLLRAQLARQLLLVLRVDGGEAEADGLELLDEVGPRRLRLAAGEAPVGVEHDEVGLSRRPGQHRVVVRLGRDARLVEDAVLAVAAAVSGAEKVREVIGRAAIGVEAVVLAVVVPLTEVGRVFSDAVVVEQTASFGVTEQLVGSETRAGMISASHFEFPAERESTASAS